MKKEKIKMKVSDFAIVALINVSEFICLIFLIPIFFGNDNFAYEIAGYIYLFFNMSIFVLLAIIYIKGELEI